MYIHEAVSAALKTGLCMRRSGPQIWQKLKVDPTNSDCGCVTYSDFSNIAPCPWWQPKAEDLLADDWILVPRD